MKKRTILLCSFALAFSSITFSQESMVTRTQEQKEITQTRTRETDNSSKTPKNSKLSQSNDLNTVDGIERELLALENVLVINKDDKSFDKVFVENRIAELKVRKEQLSK